MMPFTYPTAALARKHDHISNAVSEENSRPHIDDLLGIPQRKRGISVDVSLKLVEYSI